MNLYKAPIVDDFPLTPEKMLFMPTNQADLQFQQYSPQQLEQARLGRYDNEAKQYADRLSQDNMTPIKGIAPQVQSTNPVNPWGPELNKPYAAPEPVAAPVAPKPLPPIDPNSYLGGLIANSTPKPKYNQKTEDQLRNMAKAQKIGEFLGLLGDVYGTAKGAPVQRRESTSAAPYMQSILARQDKYQEQLSDFDKAEYLRKLQIGQAFDTKKAQDEADAWRNKQFDAGQEYKKYLQTTKQNATDESLRRFNIEQENKKKNLDIAQQRADKSGTKDNVKIQTDKQVYTFTPEEASLRRGEAYNSPEVHALHPDWFIAVPGKSTGRGKQGKITYKPDPRIKPEDWTRAWIEVNQEGLKPDGPKPGSKEYLDQIRSEKELPLSTDPLLTQPVNVTNKPIQSEFTPEQENQINLLHKKNPNATRQQIIDYIQTLK